MSSKDEKNDKTKDKKEKKKYKQQDGEEGEEPQEREIKMKLTKKESKLRAPVYYVSDKTQVSCVCNYLMSWCPRLTLFLCLYRLQKRSSQRMITMVTSFVFIL